MTIRETLAFGGSALDRAAHLRGNIEQMAQMLAQGQVLPLWRGKPLIHGHSAAIAGLAWVASDSPVLLEGTEPVFLGMDEGVPRFAVDISRWQPSSGDPIPQGFYDPTEQRHPALAEDQVFAELRGLMLHLTAREAELAATAKALVQWHVSHRFCAACGQPSDVVMAGWQRTCPSCRSHHFPRTDPVVIMLVTRGNKVLLGRSPGWPTGMYSCLAGFVEPGETLEAAVRREVAEETGVRVGPVRYLASQPWPFPASLMIGCHGLAETEEIILDPAELEHALWLSREDMAQAFAGGHPLVRPPRKGAIAQYLIANWLADSLD